MKSYRSIPLESVRLTDNVLSLRQKICFEKTIPANIQKTIETGRINSFDLENYHGMRHIYWDSDVAKVVEGISYALKLRSDGKLQELLENWIKKIISVQTADGYLNSYFTGENADRRWDKLCVNHQLYCAGHLMEAAVAARGLPGGEELMKAMVRYADYIASYFGSEEGKTRGWPGHEEIELALVKFYQATGNKKYLDLARYFVEDRGTEPNIFAEEGYDVKSLPNLQAEKPVRQMTEITGHAVRAVYFLAGVTDVASETKDDSLLETAEKLTANLIGKRMYITGGIGSSFKGEAITGDHDLTNSSLMYAESCAAMGLAQLMRRLYNVTGKKEYADVMEKVIYNSILAGISLAGDTFFYTNYLEVDDNTQYYNSGAPERQPWFRTSCCPTSYSRFLPQLGSFLYSFTDDEISLLIPAANTAEIPLACGKISLTVEGNYPYDGHIRIIINTAGRFKLNCRIPGWCRKAAVSLNGTKTDTAVIDREWQAGDTVQLDLDMPVEFMRANQKITVDLGRIALMRGPLVYALEEIDQSAPVREMLIDTAQAVEFTSVEGLPAGTVALTGSAVFEKLPQDELYTAAVPEYISGRFTAIPYALWQNRERSNMCVWNRCLKTV